MVADGTYTAKVELDMGPYFGIVNGQKTVQLKRPRSESPYDMAVRPPAFCSL